ncbi:hypothetical protein [Oleiagrimonas sp. C23AA]|uniref:hypothetical protein n=1 Tax=Oleiagrimonas sp. C23AA TaxID=2719047 RepID=UPI000A894B94|nr:hypothetical protein [Oleiagrimonas sp. C23AA]NII11041.1 hypothetical protein [Oleiagrimonas sp. C23AA]
MSLSFRLRPTKRSSLFWLVALLLLWQQMALATALCRSTDEEMSPWKRCFISFFGVVCFSC